MGSVDRVGDRSFKVNFTVDGVLRLREKVNEKLKEFMGDYTDDALVDYVIVLLKNGRQKEQAKNELNVFLGDDSDSFVCWLWDHLTLNIDLYVQPKEVQDGAPERIISEVQASGDNTQLLNSESDRGKSHKLSRRRHNKDWKGLVREETEPPTLHSSVVDNSHLEEKILTKVDRHPRSPPPSPLGRRKRGHPDEPKTKRDAISQATINAPRRLLQFAVRDAVATSRPLNSGPYVEPSLKRLRSVVSTSSGDSSLAERPQRLQPVPRLSNPMSTVIKAVAEAAEDVMKFKSSGSVFDRLGRGMNPSDDSGHKLEDDYQNQEQNQSMNLQRTDFSGQYASSNAMLEDEADFPSDYTSDNEGYNDENVVGHRGIGAFQIASSGGNRVDNLSTVQYSVAQNPDDNMHLKQNRDHEQPVAPNTSHKMVNISVNVNTWKSPQYQEPKEVAEMDGLKIKDSEAGPPRYCHQLMKDKASTPKVSNGNANPAFDVHKESQKTQVSTSGGSGGCPLEDADSRTIFVSNVHFAATKDSLSRHFNKFGDVLKVAILVDAATGQPKGSAYVEFMRKESAENALSLDGTSFISRILKVVKKNAAPQESTATMAWPRGVRGSSFPAARFSRAPFLRGVPGAFWSRPPMRVGARSMQWKRDAQGTTNPDSGASLNTSNIAVPAARGLTYVRTASKPESN